MPEKKHDTKIIVISNNKGGVAKSTTCTSIAHLAGKKGYRILVIDLDTQMNASELLGYPPRSKNSAGKPYPSVADYLSTFFEEDYDYPDVNKYILDTPYENVDVMLGSFKMQSEFEQSLKTASLENGDLMEHLFVDIKQLNKYDLVFIDTPPHLGVHVTSAFRFADYLIATTDPDKMGVEGVVKVCSYIQKREKKRLPVAQIAGVIFCKVDERNLLGKAIPIYVEQLNAMSIPAFMTVIPISVDVSKSRTLSKPVTEVFPSSKVTKKYKLVLEELEGILNE